MGQEGTLSPIPPVNDSCSQARELESLRERDQHIDRSQDIEETMRSPRSSAEFDDGIASAQDGGDLASLDQSEPKDLNGIRVVPEKKTRNVREKILHWLAKKLLGWARRIEPQVG
ncbi:hypothetical protein NMY22_g12084 [Coprinellus aureogranulatus]|nr:hypothetical protein NMY22_g12084 [Coprinellus aureogranulatus]